MQTFSYLPGPSLRTPGRGVQQECSAQVHRRLDALVEDPDLRAVADADDVPVDRHPLVAGAQVADRFLGRGEGQLFRTHGRTQTSPFAATWALARRAAQHW